VSLGNGKADGVADTLAERAGGDLDARGVMGLGVTGGDAVDGLVVGSVVVLERAEAK
jgi:hypothetical protein